MTIYPRLDTTDTMRGLGHHTPDGETYVVEVASLWDVNDQCVGSRIVRASGPVYYADVLYTDEDDPADDLVGTPRWAEIRDWDFTADIMADDPEQLATWLDDEEAAGRFVVGKWGLRP